MNRAHFIGVSAALLAATPLRARTQSGVSRRSLWVWHTPLDRADSVVRFAQRNSFGTIYLSLSAEERSAVDAGDADAQRSLEALRNAHLKTYAVAGDPSWVKRSRDEPPKTMQLLLNVQRKHGAFSGLALDLEPHTLPEWKDENQRPALIENYLEILKLARDSAAAAGLPVLATVHPTYTKYSAQGGGGTLLERAAQIVDETDLMAYRNALDKLESFGGSAMKQLAATAKPWWLGVSTHADAPSGTSYATVPSAQFFPDIDATSAFVKKYYGGDFRGISVEDYQNTAALLGET
jgi:hypothetical protein